LGAGTVGAILAGVFLVVLFTPMEAYSNVSASRLHQGCLLIAAGLVMLANNTQVTAMAGGRETNANRLLPVIVISALALGWLTARNWKPGWYYLLDPAGSAGLAWTVLVSAAVQLGAMGWMGRLGARSEE
jgi:hypothetical protein